MYSNLTLANWNKPGIQEEIGLPARFSTLSIAVYKVGPNPVQFIISASDL